MQNIFVKIVSSQVQIKMAQVIITVKLMPVDVDVDLSKLEKSASKEIEKFGGKIGRVTQEPIAFGLNALMISFFSDESKSNLDPLEESLRNVTDVESVDIVEVRRALG